MGGVMIETAYAETSPKPHDVQTGKQHIDYLLDRASAIN